MLTLMIEYKVGQKVASKTENCVVFLKNWERCVAHEG